VPTPSQPDRPEPSEAAARPVIPGSVRIAAIAMGVLASLLLVRALVLWYGYDAAVHEITVKSPDVTRAQAGQLVLVALVPSLVMGVILALAAWFLPRRQPWARWIGLGASTVLTLLTLFSVVAGAVTGSSLLLLVLSAVATVSLLARTTSAWVPSLRARD
jgi:hypothetical protein